MLLRARHSQTQCCSALVCSAVPNTRVSNQMTMKLLTASDGALVLCRCILTACTRASMWLQAELQGYLAAIVPLRRCAFVAAVSSVPVAHAFGTSRTLVRPASLLLLASSLALGRQEHLPRQQAPIAEDNAHCLLGKRGMPCLPGLAFIGKLRLHLQAVRAFVMGWQAFRRGPGHASACSGN